MREIRKGKMREVREGKMREVIQYQGVVIRLGEIRQQ